MRCHWMLLAIVLGGLGFGRADETRIGLHTFTHPAGFQIEKVAGPPLVDRPIVGDFDDQGHLYVADSAGVNDKVEQQLEEKPHRIVRLTDVDGDGIYDRSIVFADRMMFPEGILCHDGAVYCAAPPSIWKLTDTDGDGRADEQVEWFNGGTLTGCANDLHGPYLSPDGWIYWTKGAFAKLDLTLGDGSRLTDSAAHLFRARPDGTGLESFAAGGMDNPVDVTFGPAGDVFFSSTFLVQPAEGKRDGLIHSIYGSVYPKRHGVIDGFPRTDLGDGLMPAMTHLGPAAPSGLEVWQSTALGEEVEGNLFSALFNMRKVMRHQLVRRGATFETIDSDFMVSDQVDFHPTDVKEDADGS
ncbi:MAG: PVC-type heme-binding CxxCH protein, partial [Verrucomicrobiota bacterium]